MRILITGAGGFVGGAVAAEFSEPGEEVFLAFHRKRPRGAEAAPESCFSIDLTDPSETSRFMKLGRVDAVIHAAGLAHQFGPVNDDDFHRVNVLGTENALTEASKLAAKHFVLISSVAVYGGNSHTGADGANEETTCRPSGPYAKSKLAAEKSAELFCSRNDLRLTILRPATVVGEGDPGNVRRLVEAIDRRKFRWIGRGRNRKSLVYVKDLARACRFALENGSESPAVFNVSGGALPMAEIVSVIASGLGRKIPRIRIPYKPAALALRTTLKFWRSGRVKAMSETIQKWTSDDVYSAEKIGSALGFRPETSAVEALRREVAWYRGNK